MITCSLNHPKPPRSDVTVTHGSILDREKFSCDFIDSFSHGSGCRDDANALVSIYNDTLLKIYDKHAPLKMITIKHRRLAKWYNDQLRHEKREKCRLERRYRKSGLTVDMENFHEQTQKYNNFLEKTKTDYYRTKIQNSDQNQLFRLINNMFKLKPSALPSHQSSQQLAEDFNDFFINKISDIRAAIETYSYLNNNALFPSLQSAYARAHHSTETALLRVTNDILKALDSRNDVILIFLDLSAAFDTLDHDILLSRLHLYFGFKGIALNWFTSYFQGRTQRVNIAGSSSSPRNLHYGVPQRSIL